MPRFEPCITWRNDVTGMGQHVEVDDWILSTAKTMNALSLTVFISHQFKEDRVNCATDFHYRLCFESVEMSLICNEVVWKWKQFHTEVCFAIITWNCPGLVRVCLFWTCLRVHDAFKKKYVLKQVYGVIKQVHSSSACINPDTASLEFGFTSWTPKSVSANSEWPENLKYQPKTTLSSET